LPPAPHSPCYIRKEGKPPPPAAAPASNGGHPTHQPANRDPAPRTGPGLATSPLPPPHQREPPLREGVGGGGKSCFYTVYCDVTAGSTVVGRRRRGKCRPSLRNSTSIQSPLPTTQGMDLLVVLFNICQFLVVLPISNVAVHRSLQA
jgi:hypothetical protein